MSSQFFSIEKEYHFHFGHRNPGLEGKCSRIHGHTATFWVELKPIPQKDNKSGVTIEFEEIDVYCKEVVDYLDHYLLLHEDDPLCEVLRDSGFEFREFEFPPSAENMAKYIHDMLSNYLPVSAIHFKETTSSKVVYYG